jgi:hypothetical protein
VTLLSFNSVIDESIHQQQQTTTINIIISEVVRVQAWLGTRDSPTCLGIVCLEPPFLGTANTSTVDSTTTSTSGINSDTSSGGVIRGGGDINSQAAKEACAEFCLKHYLPGILPAFLKSTSAKKKKSKSKSKKSMLKGL